MTYFRMRTALFWAMTQRVLVISYGSLRTTYQSHLQASIFFTAEDRTDRFFRKVGKKNHQYSLRNSSEERSSHLQRGRRLKSRIGSYEIKILKCVLRRELIWLGIGYGGRHLRKKNGPSVP